MELRWGACLAIAPTLAVGAAGVWIMQGDKPWANAHQWVAPAMLTTALAWPVCVWQWKHIQSAWSRIIRSPYAEIKSLRSKLSEQAELDRQLAELHAELTKVKQALSQRESAEKAKAEHETQRKGRLQKAPRIKVHFSEENRRDTLLFENDGEQTARDLVVGPLRWVEERSIRLAHEIPVLQSHHRESCGMTLFESSHSQFPLAVYMREHAPADAKTVVTVGWHNEDGDCFTCDFSLKSFGDGKVNWNPGDVKLQEPYGSQRG
ncbi:MAG: hypothetical protein WBW58_02825 [Candidatus Acidiferrum sp.]